MTPLATLFNMDGILFMLRWLHILAGMIWIGHLYYFNFTQTPFFAETEAPVRSGAIQKLVPRALWWFRWGAFWTFLLGLILLAAYGHQFGNAYFGSSRGISVLIGGLMGTVMAANVWFVIWPAQQVVIKNAIDTAAGQPANPAAAARGARASVASRTNVLLSIPMLFLMAASTHWAFLVDESSNLTALWIAIFIIVGAIEVNALKGKLGPMATVKGTVGLGFALTAVTVLVMHIFI